VGIVANAHGRVKVCTRHRGKCVHKDDLDYTKCYCPKWLYSNHNGVANRESLGTTSFSEAHTIAMQRLAEFDPTVSAQRRVKQRVEAARQTNTPAKMVELFLDACEERNGRNGTWTSYCSFLGFEDSKGFIRGKFLRYIERWNQKHGEGERIDSIEDITQLWLIEWRKVGGKPAHGGAALESCGVPVLRIDEPTGTRLTTLLGGKPVF
jgi:hypothetical protein